MTTPINAIPPAMLEAATAAIRKVGYLNDTQTYGYFRRLARTALAAADVGAMAARIAELETACKLTIDENLHLADGEDCTLIHLKRAIKAQTGAGGE